MMKPCPFCGHDIIKLESWQNYDHTEYAGICQNCGAQGPNDLGTSGAIEMWDMRRPEDALRAQRDELAGMVEKLEKQVNLLSTERRKARIEELNPYKDRLWRAGCKKRSFGNMIEEIIEQRDAALARLEPLDKSAQDMVY